jgi:hypothetical protein
VAVELLPGRFGGLHQVESLCGGSLSEVLLSSVHYSLCLDNAVLDKLLGKSLCMLHRGQRHYKLLSFRRLYRHEQLSCC